MKWFSKGQVPHLKTGPLTKDVRDSANGEFIAWVVPEHVDMVISAPDMFAALKSIADSDDADGAENVHPWCKLAREVIAKIPAGKKGGALGVKNG